MRTGTDLTCKRNKMPVVPEADYIPEVPEASYPPAVPHLTLPGPLLTCVSIRRCTSVLEATTLSWMSCDPKVGVKDQGGLWLVVGGPGWMGRTRLGVLCVWGSQGEWELGRIRVIVCVCVCGGGEGVWGVREGWVGGWKQG